jgi:hypothetical protein
MDARFRVARNPDLGSKLPYLVWLPIEGGVVLKARDAWPRATRRGSWLADMLGRWTVRYPEVPIVFAGSRKFAEEWAYRFFGAAVGDSSARDRPRSDVPVNETLPL